VPAPARPAQLPFGYVNIYGGSYAWFDGLTFARKYANVGAFRVALSAVRLCPGVKLYGYVGSRGAGIVGRSPSNLQGCLAVQGGGPSAGCAQAKLTPYPDPYGLSGLSLSRSYVLLIATSDSTCRDLSTQLPGGIWASINRASSTGVPAGSVRVIKCQQWDGQEWWDFMAPYSSKLPASKRTAFWIRDRYVNTRYARWNGIPTCD
jgi:hypothetical protein